MKAHPYKIAAVALLLVGAWAGCSKGGDAGEPTFARDVAPILHRSCSPCHRPGESAPFPLLTYRDAQKRSRQLAVVVESRFMPPWLPEPGPHPLADSRRLSDEEVDTFVRWAAAGAPLGDPQAVPPPPSFPDGWQLGVPDLVLETPRAYPLAAEGTDELRNLVIPVPIERTRFVHAFELRPGDTAAVHHAILAVDRRRECRRLESEDPLPGFEGMMMGSAEPPDGHFLGWTPGRAPYQVPEDMAFRLRPGDDLVLQLHMVHTGREERVAPTLGLYFGEREPTRFPQSVELYSQDIDIPAGSRDTRVTDAFPLPVDVELLGIYPHAHYLGKRVVGEARYPDGRTEELLRIEDWDFNWQEEYRLQAPLALPAGTVLHMEWTYDNSAQNPRNPHQPPQRVRFGERSEDEMGTITFTVLPREPDGAHTIKKLHWARTVERKPWDWAAYNTLGWLFFEEGNLEQATGLFRAALELRPDFPEALTNLASVAFEMGQPDTSLPLIERALELEPEGGSQNTLFARVLAASGRSAQAIAHLRAFLGQRPDQLHARLVLADLLALGGRPQEALPEYRRVLGKDPELPEAHNNLANTLFTVGDVPGAIEHYRRTLTLRPEHFGARFNLGRALHATRRLPEAAQALRRALELRPEDEAVRAALARVERELAGEG